MPGTRTVAKSTPAIDMAELTSLLAIELRRRTGAKQISPVELMQACIARIERFNPAVNAICATDFERVLQAAKQAEEAVMKGHFLGPLHGLPLGVKDLVARLRQMGAIVTAKTNVPDMGAGADTRNPVWGQRAIRLTRA